MILKKDRGRDSAHVDIKIRYKILQHYCICREALSHECQNNIYFA